MSFINRVVAHQHVEHVSLRSSGWLALLVGLVLLGGCAGPPAPGRPGAPALWTPANKVGFGTARGESRLAWRLGRDDARTYTEHIRKAADFLVANGPVTPQERWENQGGYSPGTIAAEVAGLVCAADLARRNGDTASAGRYEATADAWQRQVEGWMVTSNGPLAPHPYYLRLTPVEQPSVVACRYTRVCR